MMRHSLAVILSLLLGSLPGAAFGAPAPPQAAAPPPNSRVSSLTAEQLVQILDQTVDWYRTLGVQQQSATQPSDLLLLYANRQTADNVVRLAFQIARNSTSLRMRWRGSSKDASAMRLTIVSCARRWKRSRDE